MEDQLDRHGQYIQTSTTLSRVTHVRASQVQVRFIAQRFVYKTNATIKVHPFAKIMHTICIVISVEQNRK